MPLFRTISILGTGSALPERVLTSAEIDARLGKPSGWTEAQVGVASRRASAVEDQIDLAEMAARRALADAGCRVEDIGLLISAAAVPYQPIPATAPLLQ